MNIAEIFLTAFSLASDAFAASVSRGSSPGHKRLSLAASTAVAFGFFQGAMPMVGWMLGSTFAKVASGIAPFISFALLCGIGVGMIYDSVTEKEHGQKKKSPSLLGLAFATSVDALSAGIGFGICDAPVLLCSFTVGAVTFVLSFIGVSLGHTLGVRWGKGATFFGGVLLCGIGIKILIEFFLSK